MDDHIASCVLDNMWCNIFPYNVFGVLVDSIESASGYDRVISPMLNGQFDAPYVMFYQYIRDIHGLASPKLWPIEEQVQFGCVYPLQKSVIICRRPEFIHLNSSKDLHCDGGPAMRYHDGFSIYALNGVRVPKWLAVMNKDDIDPMQFKAIRKAEVRRQFIQKVGVDRIAESCYGGNIEKLEKLL